MHLWYAIDGCMLIIEEGQDIPLPKKYHSVNNLCAVIYDQLTSILTEKHFLKHIVVDLTIDPAHQQFVDELKNDSIHAFDFMKANGLNKELTEILTKHITMSVLGDFIDFVYESLSCAQRGKMSVAYALLRKPLTDELLIFEQLLVAPVDFVRLYFHVGDPKGYDPSGPNLNRLQIIQDVFNVSDPGPLYTTDLVHGLRYDKQNPSGINGVSNQALHIVTTHRAYRTEDGELNFVYSNRRDYQRYWRHYYYFVPYLLIYAAHVIDELVFGWMPDFRRLRAVRAFQRLVGIFYWSKFMQGRRKQIKASHQKMLTIFAQSLNGPCDHCGKQQVFTDADFLLFFNELILLCPYCLHNHLTSPGIVERIILLVESVQSNGEV